MNRDETIQYIYDLGLVEGYLGKLIYQSDKEDYDDFLQEIWVQVCEIPEEKWEKLWAQGTKNDGAKAVRGYISGLIHRNVRSKNSRLYYKIKKHYEKEIPFSEYLGADGLFNLNEEAEDIL